MCMELESNVGATLLSSTAREPFNYCLYWLTIQVQVREDFVVLKHLEEGGGSFLADTVCCRICTTPLALCQESTGKVVALKPMGG